MNPDQALTLTDKQIVTSEQWKYLNDNCSDALNYIRIGHGNLIRGYWKLGIELLKAKDRGDFGYGNKYIDIFAAHHKLSSRTLYQALDVADECRYWGDEDNIIGHNPTMLDLLNELEKQGKTKTWTSVRNRRQLLGLPSEQTDPKQAEKVGGKDRQSNNLMQDFEVAQHRIAEYVEKGVPDDQKDVLSGPLVELARDMFVIAENLQPGILSEMVQKSTVRDDNPQETTLHVESEIVEENHDITTETRYLEHIINCGCTFCHPADRRPPKTNRLWPDSKRPEWQQVSLCLRHEQEAMSHKETWSTAMWSKYRMNVVDWFYHISFHAIERMEDWKKIALQEKDFEA